jgi:hypothetical protein
MSQFCIIKAVHRLDLPPAVEDREEFRAWFLRLVDVLAELAGHCFLERASRTAAIALALGTDDDYWKSFHSALVVALGYCSCEDRAAACTHCVAVAEIARDQCMTLEQVQEAMWEITEIVHYFRGHNV